MTFIIKPYVGALPLLFGMNRDQVSELFSSINVSDIVTFGPCRVNITEDIFLHFEDGSLSEIEFYTGTNNYITGELAELTSNLILTLEMNDRQFDILQANETLGLLNELDDAKYADGAWIYPKVGAALYGYDGSQDYRSICLFNADLLSFNLKGAVDAPASTRLRPTN